MTSSCCRSTLAIKPMAPRRPRLNRDDHLPPEDHPELSPAEVSPQRLLRRRGRPAQDTRPPLEDRALVR